MRSIFSLIFLLLCIIVSAQTIHKTLIIDTLITNDYRFYISRTDPVIDFEPIALNDEQLNRSSDTYPNLTCELGIIHDTAIVRIGIDNKSGYLQLNNLYHLKNDTIRIDKIELFENCLRDTTFTAITYWNETDTGLVEPPFKDEFKTKASKPTCKRKPIEQLVVTINGKEYSCALSTKGQGTHNMHFHGRKPKKYSNDRDHYHGKKKIYFSGREIRVEYVYTCELELQE